MNELAFTYRLQLPDMNCLTYSTRVISTGRTRTDAVFVDLSPLNTGGDIQDTYVPGDQGTFPTVCAIWTSMVLNQGAWSRRFPLIPPFRKLWTDEIAFERSLGNRHANLDSLRSICEAVNMGLDGVQLTLQKIPSWDQVPIALAEGFSVMVGGSLYKSFLAALHGGIVPMPSPGEGLLGGHIFNVVSLDPAKDVATVIGNLGMQVGNRGMFKVRSAYLRNLDINRDFFLLTMERA